MRFKKFTFKTEKATGKFRSFHSDSHTIKLNGIWCGKISEIATDKWEVRMMVQKDDPETSANPNCTWKWVAFKKKHATLDDAKSWVRANNDVIQDRFTIYLDKE